MQMTGRAQVSAPTCSRSTAIDFRAGNESGNTNGTVKVFSTVDTFLTVATTAGVAPATLTVKEAAGITIGQTVTLGYGTEREETVLTHASAVTEAEGTAAVELAGSQTLKYAHPVGERAVIVKAAIRPGSIVIKNEGTSIGATDNGDGTISSTLGVGTYDPSVGSLTFSYTVAPATGKDITYDVELLADSPAMEDRDGRGFFKNFVILSQTRQSAPHFAAISNLGSSDIGCFFEISRNNGKTFSMKGNAGAGCKLGSMGRGRARVPSLSGEVHEMVRFRAGAAPDTAVGSQTEEQKRYIADGLVEVDTQTILVGNGGGI